MALSQKLDLRQGQSLTMTPQLQQAIKLLQMSNIDLQAFIQGELDKNPLLESGEWSEAPALPVSETGGGDIAGPLDQASALAAAPQDAGEASQDPYSSDTSAGSARSLASPGNQGEWTSSNAQTGGSRASPDADFDIFDTIAAREMTLYDHLASQLMVATADPVIRLVGHTLIGMLDEAGYFAGDLAGVAKQLGTSLSAVEAALGLIQGFDPAGMGARSLQECLTLQLAERKRLDPPMVLLLERLDLLAARDYRTLCARCGVTLDDVALMVAEIRRLDPKPGLRFGSEIVQSVVPDIFVRAAPDGSWLVELNNETLPRVLVNQHYAALVGRKRDADRVYVAEHHARAQWLVRSLDQRARTILKVAQEIVRQQDLFLARGVHHLRPLTLKAVAEATGMHESTISRVTSNKYMSTPRGTFDLKYFFSTGLMDADGNASHSAEAVRQKIRDLLAAETAGTVLSDDQIVEALAKTGISLARRTVAKYREALGIAASAQRRRELRVAAIKTGV